MKQRNLWPAAALACAVVLSLTACPVKADTTITEFQNFTSDALYAGWSSATIVSGADSYDITASGYGSNWKYLPTSAGPTDTNIQLTVALSGGGDGQLGPIVTLVDGAGREYNFAWYGSTLGSHVLIKPVQSPTWKTGPAGALDIANLNGIHMQIDPSSYAGTYTISWQSLKLVQSTNPPPPITITSKSYDRASQMFTLTWTSVPGQNYSVLYSSELSTPMTELVGNIPADTGATTTTSVIVPNGDVGFLRIKLQ